MGKYFRIKNLEIGRGRPKTCAVVMGKTEQEILSLGLKANSIDCDMIEFRADDFLKILDFGAAKTLLGKLRKACNKPIIFTFRRKAEGGHTDIDFEYYKKLNMTVAKNGYAEIVDIEALAAMDEPEFINDLKLAGAYVIVSKHDFNRTPPLDDIIQDFFELQSLGGDIIKVSYMPSSKSDVLTLITATENMTSSFSLCPIIAISMGHLGTISRILGEFIGSAITFATINKSSAPGQLPIEGLTTMLSTLHDNSKTIFLVGFMGTGKTSVANQLYSSYGMSHLDLDAYIEEREHMNIADIFAHGEDEFRDKETKYLRQIVRQNYHVVSLGGGIVMKQENIEIIKSRGVIVLLTASLKTIIERLKDDKTRPLIAQNFDLQYISDLMKLREDTYNEVADIVIDTNNKNIDQICQEILETLGLTL